MVDLTVIILTKNEESNIEKCLKSLGGVAKRIVIVDSGSEDDTIAKAQKLGAETVYHAWEGYHAKQLNWALEHLNITTAWIMRLDADEEVTIELLEELEKRLPKLEENICGIELKRRVYFMGRWIKHGGVYPTILLRIFRTGSCHCEETIMDEHMILEHGETVRFAHDIIDQNTKPLSFWTEKHNWYSDREIVDYLNKQKQIAEEKTVLPKFWGSSAEHKRWLKYILYYKTPLMRRAHWYFIYRYVIRLGFLDGTEGLIFHFLQGYWYRFLVDAKMYQQKKEQNLK